jgi:hypothetical protein
MSMEKTQEKEIIHVQYDCYSIGSRDSGRAQRRLFHIEKMEMRCCKIGILHKEYVEDYISLLETTKEGSKIELDVRGLDVGFRDVPVIVPRGGYILGMLAMLAEEEEEEKENNAMIKKLLSEGATPCQDVTTWEFGQKAWLKLTEVIKEHEGRKMAKPAFSVHN